MYLVRPVERLFQNYSSDGSGGRGVAAVARRCREPSRAASGALTRLGPSGADNLGGTLGDRASIWLTVSGPLMVRQGRLPASRASWALWGHNDERPKGESDA